MNPFTPSDELMDLYDFSATDANNHGDLRVLCILLLEYVFELVPI